jgi:hypothetical protein
MKTKALTAAQIDTLAQRLSETTIEPSASAKKAGDKPLITTGEQDFRRLRVKRRKVAREPRQLRRFVEHGHDDGDGISSGTSTVHWTP